MTTTTRADSTVKSVEAAIARHNAKTDSHINRLQRAHDKALEDVNKLCPIVEDNPNREVNDAYLNAVKRKARFQQQLRLAETQKIK